MNFHFAVLVVFSGYLTLQAKLAYQLTFHPSEASSPFSAALVSLQNQIGYSFRDGNLLRRAMTHASFSEENNKALSVLGESVIAASAALKSLEKDIDVSASDLNSRMLEVLKVNLCAADGLQLHLHEVIRVSSKTNSSSPAVVCGSFRAIFGAIAVDTGRVDSAGNVFWSVHAKCARKSTLSVVAKK